jgi:cell division septum initiation protein DivIVA
MVSRDVATLFMVHMPDDEVRSLRDSIAKAEAELTAPVWERHRELHGRIEELKRKCEEAAHSLEEPRVHRDATGRDRRVRRPRATCTHRRICRGSKSRIEAKARKIADFEERNEELEMKLADAASSSY